MLGLEGLLLLQAWSAQTHSGPVAMDLGVLLAALAVPGSSNVEVETAVKIEVAASRLVFERS